MNRRPGASAMALAALLACVPEAQPGSEPILVSDVVLGLRATGADRASNDNHFAELLVHEGHVYVADSDTGVVAMRLDDTGELTTTHVGEPGEGRRCTTLALHAATDSLYCAAEAPPEEPRLERFDVSTPGQPVHVETVELPFRGARDIDVVDGQLVFAAFDDGVWISALDDSGAPAAPEPTGLDGNARFISPVGEGRAAIAYSVVDGPGTELRLYAVAGAGDVWQELDRLELEGSTQGLSLDADGAPRLTVALGSLGMVTVDVGSEGFGEQRSLEVPGVVTRGLTATDLAVAVTLGGVLAYDTTDADSPRLFGFGPESAAGIERNGNMLHGVLIDGEVVTSDWTWVERWAIDPTGDIGSLEMPRGVYLQPGETPRWRMRNLGGVELRAEFWFRGELLFELEVPPRSDAVYTVAPDVFEPVMEANEGRVNLGVRVHDPIVDPTGEPLSYGGFTLLWPQSGSASPPTPGESFGPVTVADIDHAVYALPLPDEPLRVVWYTIDCALMWPELEDLAWLDRHEHPALVGGRPVFVAPTDVSLTFARRWGLEDAMHGLFGPELPAEVDESNAALYGDDLFRSFIVYDIPGDAWTTDYELSADGRVLSIERMYRGPWTLAVHEAEQ